MCWLQHSFRLRSARRHAHHDGMRSPLHSLVRCVLPALAGAFLCLDLPAQTVIDSHPYATGGSYSVYRLDAGDGFWTAQRLTVAFSTGESGWELNSVELMLRLDSGSLNGYTAAIYTTGSEDPEAPSFGPASELVELVFPHVTVQANYAFLPAVETFLEANTTYWISLTPSLTSFSELWWFRSSGEVYDGYSIANVYGGFSEWWVGYDTNAPLTFAVYGTAVSGPAVPEPAVFAVVTGVIALGIVLIKRRRHRVDLNLSRHA